MLRNVSLRSIPRAVSLRNMWSSVDRSLIDKLKSSKEDVILTSGKEITLLAMNYQAKKNALSKSFVASLSDAVTELEVDTKSRIIIVCSLVQDVFCAGADLRERAEISDKNVPALVFGLRSLFQRIYMLPMPTVAAIDGAAFGGGLELALACDIRYAGILPKCRVGLIETHWGLLPGAGGSQRLPRLINPSRAKELMFAAMRITAEDAAKLDIVNEAVDPNSVPDEWREFPSIYRSLQYANLVCSKGPVAVRQLKRAINQGLEVGSLEAGLSIEGQCYRTLASTKDRKEGMAAFKEKRDPIFVGN